MMFKFMVTDVSEGYTEDPRWKEIVFEGGNDSKIKDLTKSDSWEFVRGVVVLDLFGEELSDELYLRDLKGDSDGIIYLQVVNQSITRKHVSFDVRIGEAVSVVINGERKPRLVPVSGNTLDVKSSSWMWKREKVYRFCLVWRTEERENDTIYSYKVWEFDADTEEKGLTIRIERDRNMEPNPVLVRNGTDDPRGVRVIADTIGTGELTVKRGADIVVSAELRRWLNTAFNGLRAVGAIVEVVEFVKSCVDGDGDDGADEDGDDGADGDGGD